MNSVARTIYGGQCWSFVYSPRTLVLLFAALLNALGATNASAQSNGTWSASADGNWGTASNWQSSTIANGVGATATFPVFLADLNRTITLDTSRTIGNLTFGGWTESNWTLAGPGTLTLDVTSGSPTIDVQELATISAVIGGSDGLSITGGGLLVLTGNNSYTGTVSVGESSSGGSLRAVDGVGLSSGSNLLIGNGVLETSGSITRTVGTGAGQVQWSLYSGGFAAVGGALDLQLGAGELTAGSGGFVLGLAGLKLGSLNANNVVELKNNLNLAGSDFSVQVVDNPNSSADFARFSGNISNGILHQIGNGTLDLTGTNSFSELAIHSGGAVRAAEGSSLPTNAKLTFYGGVFESSGNFTRTLGSGNGQVSWNISENGGFSANGGTLNVQLNNGTGTVTWGNSPFVQNSRTLLFGSATADSMVDFQNAINLNGQVRTIQVRDNPSSNSDLAKISGAITGGGIDKTGAGTLWLSNSGNNYSGQTNVVAGALRAVEGQGLSANSNLILNGGVLESSGTFNRNLGTGGGQVRWASSAGFAAQGGNLTVQLNGNTNSIDWGNTANFLGQFESLEFGSITADSVVDFQNGLNLGGGERFVSVSDNPSSLTDAAKISGVISNGALTKEGAGLLTLSGANTYTGATSVLAGTLELAAAQQTSSISVSAGATLTGDAGASGASLNVSGTLAGNGTYGATNLNNGSTLSPGNSPGNLHLGDTTIIGAGNYNWQIYDATGAAGVGYDTISIDGTLDLYNASGYNINLWSLSQTAPLTDVSGDAINFNNSLFQSWKLYQTTSGVVGFDAANFNVNVAPFGLAQGFTNTLSAFGAFYLSVSGDGNDLLLNYSPTGVPEPGTLLLAALAAGPVGFQAWRRRKARRDSTVA